MGYRMYERGIAFGSQTGRRPDGLDSIQCSIDGAPPYFPRAAVSRFVTATHLHTLPTLGMCGCVPPEIHTSS